jgi:GT2 family glycosyltransferase
MKICIPYCKGNIGRAYNDVCRALAPGESVLMLDGDVMMLTPHWYGAVELLARDYPTAGWISVVTNDCFCDAQWVASAPRTHDLSEHARFAALQWQRHGIRLRWSGDMPRVRDAHPLRGVFSGFFILTNRAAWERVGGFAEHAGEVKHRVAGVDVRFRCDGHLGVDNDYCLKLRAAGLDTLVAPGLYCYHGRELV